MNKSNHFFKSTKFVLLLLAFFLSYMPVVAQDVTFVDVTSEFLDSNQTQQQNNSQTQLKEETTLNSNSQKEMPSLQECTDNLNQLDLASMTASELCDNLINQTETLLNQVETLRQQALTSQNLQESLASELTITKMDLTKSMQDLQDVRTALKSNREDTHNLVEVLGEALNEVNKQTELVNYYSQRLKRNVTVGNWLLPSSFISGGLLVSGVWCIVEGNLKGNDTLNKTGWILAGVGAGGFITIEVVWNLGSSPKLRIW